MNVLSLFDGMSCGQMALERAGIPIENYFASEIDKYAIQVTQYHYPKTIQLGDILGWQHWNLPKIDLIIAGSPCQGFSNAGLGLNFDDPRSKLFFTFCDILAVQYGKNPELKYMLENVKMRKAWQDIITDRMKVEPVLIDSALVSAQSRRRLYWANFPITQPEDRGIILADIVENGDVDLQKSYTIDANYYKGGNPKSYFEKGRRQLVFEHQSHRRAMVKGAAIRNQVTRRGTEEQLNIRKDKKSNCVVPTYPNKLNGVVFVRGLEEGRRLHDGKSFSRNYREGYRIYSAEGKSPSLSATPKGGQAGHSGLIQIGRQVGRRINQRGKRDDYNSDIQSEQRIEVTRNDGKSGTLSTVQKDNLLITDDYHYRKLTPIECERLQTVPDDWTSMVSNTQRYKMLGNGWTIDVITHIFRCMQEQK